MTLDESTAGFSATRAARRVVGTVDCAAVATREIADGLLPPRCPADLSDSSKSVEGLDSVRHAVSPCFQLRTGELRAFATEQEPPLLGASGEIACLTVIGHIRAAATQAALFLRRHMVRFCEPGQPLGVFRRGKVDGTCRAEQPADCADCQLSIRPIYLVHSDQTFILPQAGICAEIAAIRYASRRW